MTLVPPRLWPDPIFVEITLLGAVLRIVVGSTSGHLKVAIPKLTEVLAGLSDSTLKNDVALKVGCPIFADLSAIAQVPDGRVSWPPQEVFSGDSNVVVDGEDPRPDSNSPPVSDTPAPPSLSMITSSSLDTPTSLDTSLVTSYFLDTSSSSSPTGSSVE